MKILFDYAALDSDVLDSDDESLGYFTSRIIRITLEKEKYKIMWQLRSLENEIIESGGLIIIRADGKIELKEFPSLLFEKITYILANSTE